MPGSAGTVALAENNTEGLSSVYNAHISADTLVFIHDDVVVPHLWWGDTIEAFLKVYDIVGVAGNKRTFPGQRSWYLSEDDTSWGPDSTYPENFSGAIANGTDWVTSTKQYFGPCGEVKTLDGVFLAANGKRLLEAGVSFDEDFDFHFYDMAFCARARAAGLTMGTIPLSLIHASKGIFDTRWAAALEVYRRKYG
jgi:GT2 family glycosyltransferase